VGQRVTFTLEGLPTGDIVDMKGKWNLPGKFVNQETNYSPTCTTYVRNDDRLLNTNRTAGWFYNTNDGHVSVGLNLKFNNGQYASIARNGDFTVYRPQFIGIANKSFAEVKVVGDRLGVGNGTDATNSGDMSFNVIVQTSVAGNVNCLQLASEDRDYDTTIVTSQCFSTDGQYWLDNNQTIAARHLNPDFTNIPPARYYDSPSLSGQRSVVNVNDRFVTYVQFAPADSLNDIGDSIYVTLGIIHWNWEGHAQYVDNEWKLIGTNSVSDVTDQPSDIFPVWTDVIINPGNFHLCF
jgi:hypothetical protein